MSGGPHYILIHVRDLGQARQFYMETLGYTLEGESPDYVQFDAVDGVTLALSSAAGSEPAELWWYVDNADATYETLHSSGVEIVSPPRDEPFGRALAIKDPSGHTLNLLQLSTGQ